MKKLLFILVVVMVAAGVAQANEETPFVQQAAYRYSTGTISPSATIPDSNSGMEFVHVAGGCYNMGAGAALSDAIPVHQVCVDDYFMGKYEVTQAQWRAIMGSNPSTANSCGDNCPVVDVSWVEAQEFIRRLNERTGSAYRLPTEAEWEYAVRNSGATASAEPADGTHGLRPVGQANPNGFGIYGMQGSVWEWTSDVYAKNYYRHSPQNNPEGPSDGLYRVLRGGSWMDTQASIQPTLRASMEPYVKRPWAGFRLTATDQTSAKYRAPAELATKPGVQQNANVAQSTEL